jgi:hypothetical protein
MVDRRPGEKGSLVPLIAGLAALVIALVFVVVSATSLLIERHRLHALAEAAALSAAESFDPALLRMGQGELVVPLSSDRVRADAARFLQTSGPHRHENLTLRAANTVDNRRALVVLEATWRPPVVSRFVPVSYRIVAQSRSRVMIR